MSVFFDNAYLELVYPDSAVSDSSLAAAERTDRLRRVRWRETGASPIGIGLRRLVGAPDSLPFPSTPRTQPWMQPGTEIRVVTTPVDSLAPRVFVVPRYMALTAWIDQARRDTTFAGWLRHPLGVHCLTRVRVVVTHLEGIPPHLQLLSDAGILSVQLGSRPLVELTLDGGRLGATKDFSPDLPLVIHY